jgi:tRNA pseudouridine55 synthase
VAVQNDLNGILLIDKPTGWTSHDVVAKIRNTLKKEMGQKVKAGHTGTLDPFATGLLIIVIGNYTKRAEEFSKLDKTYEAELTLGATSTTGDIEGEIIVKGGQKPSKMALHAVLSQFKGHIQQTPHKFSAMKINGQRAYKLARAGKEVKLDPRQVTIYELEMLDYAYPLLKIRAKASSGTYIRSLAEDIGEVLGTGAYLSSLRRTQAGEFDLKNSLKVNNLSLSAIQRGLQN